jgi:hypothetical protein
MTYSSGGLIQATDYNGFVSTTAGANINATWNTTYGQTALNTVSAGGTVTATQWATLNSTITSMANHQNTSITARTTPTAGATITALAAVNTDITNCYNNRYNAVSSGAQYTSWTGTASQTSVVGHRNTTWTITFTDTVTFANATAATSFFGAGGLIKIQFSKTSTGAQADSTWNSFITACGTIWLSADGASKTINSATYTGTTKTGGSGSPTTLATGTGFNQLTSTATTIFKQFNSQYVYTGDYVQVDASYSAPTLTLTTYWFSPARNVAGTTNEISGGTATSGISFGSAPTTVVTYFPPETTYLTNVWGTPTVASTVSAPTY